MCIYNDDLSRNTGEQLKQKLLKTKKDKKQDNPGQGIRNLYERDTFLDLI